MTSFERIEAIAAPLPVDNVDTDKILPAEFLKTVERKGLGRALFARMRYLDDGALNPDFVLNRVPWANAGILVAGANFGCGSSREHAPWALLDFGIRCIIAESFADIFYNNCFKNGILPVVLAIPELLELRETVSRPEQARVAVDLTAQTVTFAGARELPFDIPEGRKRALIEGRDEISETLSYQSALLEWQRALCAAFPPIVLAREQGSS